MKRTIPIFVHIVVLAFLLDFAAAAVPSREKGRADARKDIRQGVFRIYAAGKPARWSKRYDDILWKEYGVEIIRKKRPGSVDDRNYMSGYNEISIKSVEDQYGADFLLETADRAMREHQRGKTRP